MIDQPKIKAKGPFVETREAADMLGVSQATIHKMITDGRLKAFNFSSKKDEGGLPAYSIDVKALSRFKKKYIKRMRRRVKKRRSPPGHFTPNEVAEKLSLPVATIYALIRAGQLEAMNTAINPDSRRPRYLITSKAIQDFKDARRVAKPKPAAKKNRAGRSKIMEGVTQFY